MQLTFCSCFETLLRSGNGIEYTPYPDDNDDMMMEFYLRWSMKESYTKALGLGLHLEFSTFETQLNVVDAMSLIAIPVHAFPPYGREYQNTKREFISVVA